MTTHTDSILVKHQQKQFRKELRNGDVFIATVRHDDCCGNGHNSFAVTGEHYSLPRRSNEPMVTNSKGKGRWLDSRGCLHEEIAKHFPELRPAIRFHLTSTDGPLHYVANSLYWAKEGNLEHFRSTAIWPEATEETLKAEDLEQQLNERLPAIMAEFRNVVESLGFTY